VAIRDGVEAQTNRSGDISNPIIIKEGQTVMALIGK
jgi:hypothetical protein